MKPTLEDLIKFKHAGVVKRFQKEFPKMAHDAAVIFEDLMRFFWASYRHAQDLEAAPEREDLNFIYIMDEEMKPIDQMWHIFLLYTQDYMDFCQQYFGRYLHHLPDIVDGMEDDREKFEQNLEKFLNYTFDLLGEDTLRRWYAEYDV